MAGKTFRLIKDATQIDRARIRVPDWAIKTTFADDEERERFAASLAEGYTPIHVAECEEARGTYEVVDGVHRFEIIEADRMWCYNHGVKSSTQRKAIAVRLAWNFSRDNASFANVLRELQEFDASLLLWSPVEDGEIDRLIAELNDDLPMFDDEDEEEPTRASTKKATTTKSRALKIVECPHCHKEFNI